MSKSLNLIIGSAGRRLYLLRWFREAMDILEIPGKVIVTEGDPSSAAFTAGDEGISMPAYSDPRYEEAMLQMVDEYQPAMFLSVNDWELAKLGMGLGDEIRSRGVLVPGIADADIAKVTDKYQLTAALSSAGIQTPRTVLASDSRGLAELKGSYSRLIVKDRMGSGSSGLQVVGSSELDTIIERVVLTQPRLGKKSDALDELVIQPYIPATEYGIDIVGTFQNSAERKYHVLARRKIRMRAGETDKAETIDSEAFSELAAGISRALQPMGLIDVDVLVDSDGELHVIDINPRFGGGYPFVHLAGANVPLYYVASLAGRSIDNSWSTYRPGVISAKFEEIRVSAVEQYEADLGSEL